MRKKPYIIFNNINSLDMNGVTVTSMPLPSTPNRRISKVQVAGRSGDLRILESDDFGEDVYDAIEKEVKINYCGSDFNAIKKWLKGTSKLFLSNEPDRYWKASIDNAIPLEKVISKVQNGTITFSCYPYAYLKIGDKPIVYRPTSSAWKTIIMNEYDLSLPNFKIYGQGDIGMMVNGIETDFYSVDQYIECDSELQQCYKETQNLGMNMGGEFPVLYPGKNEVEFTGNIKEVVLTPHWRNL